MGAGARIQSQISSTMDATSIQFSRTDSIASLVGPTTDSSIACARTARALATTTDALLAGLAQRKAAFLGPGDDAARTVAVGNRAGDLDSIASALAVAHLTSGVALAQFARRDLALRRDASAALDFVAAGDALVFADDVSPAVAAPRFADTSSAASSPYTSITYVMWSASP